MNQPSPIVSEVAAPPQAPARGTAELLRGVLAAMPMALSLVPLAMVLGARAQQKGLGAPWVLLMTGVNFAGGSEFAALKVWSWPPDLLLIVSIIFIINSRHILMGAVLTPLLREVPRARALAALALMTDEAWALALSDTRRHGRGLLSMRYYVGVGLTLYVGWVAFAVLGALLGPLVGDPEKFGFDMALSSVFLSLLAGMWSGWHAARPWLVSLVAAALACILLPGLWPVPIGVGAGLLMCAWWAGGEDEA